MKKNNRDHLKGHASASVLLALMSIITVISIFCTPAEYSFPLLAVTILAIVSGLTVMLHFKGRIEGNAISLIDVISCLLMLILSVIYIRDRSPESELRFMFSMLTAVLYIGFKGVWMFCGERGERVFRQLLSISVIIESVYAVIQVFATSSLSDSEYICRGFFPNPGPLGGYIAVVSVALASFLTRQIPRPAVRLSVLSLLAGMSILPVTKSRSAMLAVAVCLLVWLASAENVRKTAASLIRKKPLPVVILSVMVSLSVVLAAGGMYRMKKASADSRLFINRMSLMAMKNQGLRGSGLGSYPRMYALSQSEYFSRTGYTEKERLGADSPQKGFNEFLELGVEAGVIPMVVFIILIVISVHRLLKSGSPWGYSLLALSIFSLFSYPLVFVRFRVLLAISLSRASLLCEHRSGIGCFRPIIMCVLILPFISGLTIISSGLPRHCKAVREWQMSRNWFVNGNYLTITDNWSGLYPLMKHNADFLTEYGIALSNMGLYEESDSVMTDLMRVCSDPLPLNILSENSRLRADYNNAIRWSRKAFAQAPNRILPLRTLALVYYEMADTVRFCQIRDSVMNFVPKVESARTEAAKEEIESLFEQFFKKKD